MSKEASYIEGIGRRKTSIARVRIQKDSKGAYSVNDKLFAEYFPTKELQKKALIPLEKASIKEKFKISAQIKGGGISSQAESFRLGLSRALISFDLSLRGALKKEGFLKRDPRAKERRKFGLKKARKAPQWSKR